MNLFYDLIYTRCRNGIDVESGQQILGAGDGFKVYECSFEIYENNLIDTNFALNMVQKKELFNEPNSKMEEDIYLYVVPDTGLSMLNDFHPVPFDLTVKGDFSKRPGMFLNHTIAGDYQEIYPFCFFHNKNAWIARERNEAYYYEQDPMKLSAREIFVTEECLDFVQIGRFIADGRKEVLKKAVSFLIYQYSCPIEKRQYLVIKDESLENIEMWIAAIEVAFSPRIAANISFATCMNEFPKSNIYYVNDEGRFSVRQQKSADTHARLRAMLVGVLSGDRANAAYTFSNSSYVILDGEKKTMVFDNDISGKYFDLISTFDSMHERFSREFLQSFAIKDPSVSLNDFASAYMILCGDSFGSPDEFSAALNILSEYAVFKTNIICEIYRKISERLPQFVNSSLEKSLPILNWVGMVSEIVGDSDAKKRLSEVVRKKASEVFFTDYAKNSFSDFWKDIENGPFAEEVGYLLSDEAKMDGYLEIIRSYEPQDSALFLEIYCAVCGKRIQLMDEYSKLIVSYCIVSCGKTMYGNFHKRIITALTSVLGENALKFLLISVKTYEPELLKSIISNIMFDYIMPGSKKEKGAVNEILSLYETLNEFKMKEWGFNIVCQFIKTEKDVMELNELLKGVSMKSSFSQEAQRQICELLDEKIEFSDKNSKILAHSIQKNRPKKAVCINSAHLELLDCLQEIKPEDSVETCAKAYIKQGVLSVETRSYVLKFVSVFLRSNVDSENQKYMLQVIAAAPDIYMKQYMMSLVANAEIYKNKWKETLSYIFKCSDKKAVKALKTALVNSGLKKKNMDALGKLLSDKDIRKAYDVIVDDVAYTLKKRDGSAVSGIFGRFKR